MASPVVDGQQHGGIPADITAYLDEAFPDESTTDNTDNSSFVERGRDAHRDRYPKYAAPHERGHNTDEGEQTINFRDRRLSQGPDPDKIEGVDNDKYQRVKLSVNYALTKKHIDWLKPQLPGWYFHCSGNGNHDHPLAHVVTMCGTRTLQRKIFPGAKILDVYGNPNACDRFNKSQSNAKDPKVSKAMVWNFGGPDFIREVNKWGPDMGDDGFDRFHRCKISDAYGDRVFDEYDTFQMIHTLYYASMKDLLMMVHSPHKDGKKKRILGLIHKHSGSTGTLNNGEQVYEVFGGMVKQKNVKTNSEYIHKDITPIYFAPEKTFWAPPDSNGRQLGLSWECHLVTDETWIVEIVAAKRDQWEARQHNAMRERWDTAKASVQDVGSRVQPISTEPLKYFPTLDGTFVELDVCCKPLYEKLRGVCSGRDRRDPKLLKDLFQQCNRLCDPSTLFGDRVGLSCPPERYVDHIVAALLADVPREAQLLSEVVKLKEVFRIHAISVGMGGKMSNFTFNGIVESLRSGTAIARTINKSVRQTDVVDASLGLLDNALDF